MTQESQPLFLIRRRQLIQGAAGFGAALLTSKLAGCATTTDSGATSAEGEATPTATAGEPIKLGLIAAITGPSAVSGESITRGLDRGDGRNQRQRWREWPPVRAGHS
jgi:branched-chain amino acid transport system substrate-binding protein